MSEESLQFLEQSFKAQIILREQYLLGEKFVGAPYEDELHSVKSQIHHQRGVLLWVAILMS